MPVESPIVDLSSLNENWPLDNLPDEVLEGDDHLRLIKDALKKAFTDLSSAGGVVTVTAQELNYLAGVTSNVQDQLNISDSRWVYSNAAAISPQGGDKLIIEAPVGGTVVTLPSAPTQGVEIQIMDGSGLADPPDNEIVVNRSGVDAIRDLDVLADGLISINVNGAENRLFVYLTSLWFSWTI